MTQSRGRRAARTKAKIGRRAASRRAERRAPGAAELVRAAKQAMARAYAPYSGFRVGAALLGASGRVHQGFNVENISYGLSMCAERTAVYAALISGERQFRAIAIATDSPNPISPCGACRQVLSEFCRDLPVLLAPVRGRVRRYTLKQLLPAAFFDFPGSKRPRRA
ncbi:MAG TPA: cytidine deaminase [Candidatus Saccharimonadales bacterium]|nr:cytidine deaminase [Candidatus Saccharimonadales bacterium]